MTNTIEAGGLTKRFGHTRALRGVDLAAGPGTVLALLGPNGAGKTTAVRVLATLLKADAGQARICGYDVVTEAVQVRQLIALTGQFASVDDELTGTENLLMIGRLLGFSRARARARAAELLESFDLTGAAGRAAQTYSGGRPRRPGPGGQPGRSAPGAVPGRADHRTRPTGAHPGVGDDPRRGRGRRHRAAHHAVPGGGRRAGRPDRGDRPRPGGGGRHARGTEVEDRRPDAGGPGRGPHRDRAGSGDRRGRDRHRGRDERGDRPGHRAR